VTPVDEPHPIEPSVDWTDASKGVDEAINENTEKAETNATVGQSSSETLSQETLSQETLSKEIQSKETQSKEVVTKENLNETS
ncbi:efflux transporter periplasmic adaptor subunit, partial [Vibrio sp. 10N.286.49.E1]